MISGMPSKLVEYFTEFIENLASQFTGRAFRYAKASESAHWVAYDAYKVKNTEYKKMSTTISPVLYVGQLIGSLRPLLIEFDSRIYSACLMVAYTWANDPISGDPLAPCEFECSVYYSPEHGYHYDIVSITTISKARLIRNMKTYESDYRRAKALPVYLYGRSYARYNYTLMDRRLLAKQLAVVSILTHDSKMGVAFSYAWDSYWYDKGKLETRPNYAGAESTFRIFEYDPSYTTEYIYRVCETSLVPREVCSSLFDDITSEIKQIYGLVEREAVINPSYYYTIPVPQQIASNPRVMTLYNMFPDIFSSPLDAYFALKWYHGTFDDLVVQLEETRRRRLYELLVGPEGDTETVFEY
jgi:hypothetical protein